MLRVHINVSQYSMRTSAHAHVLQIYNILYFLFPGKLDNDQIPNFQDATVDDTRLGKYPHDHNVVHIVQA